MTDHTKTTDTTCGCATGGTCTCRPGACTCGDNCRCKDKVRPTTPGNP
jgi:hypothetical protein